MDSCAMSPQSCGLAESFVKALKRDHTKSSLNNPQTPHECLI